MALVGPLGGIGMRAMPSPAAYPRTINAGGSEGVPGFMHDSALSAYGYDDAVARAAAELREAGAVPGRVSRVDRGECTVLTADGAVRAASDSQRSQGASAPAIGDWVMVSDDPSIGPVVDAVLPRATALVRRDPAAEVVEQVLAANVDVVAAVHGLARPVNPARLERLLVLAWDSGARPAIVLTKSDLGDGEAARDGLLELFDDVDVFVTSAVTGQGIDELAAYVARHGTIVFIGESGAGKSRLANALLGAEVQEVGEVRGDAKGRHTTSTRDLLPIPGGGVLIDTPGVRAVGLWDADRAVDRVFADVVEVAAGCRFRDYTHDVEPDCAVRRAVVDGELDAGRLERYRRLHEELADQAADMAERARRQDQGRRRRSAPRSRRRTRRR